MLINKKDILNSEVYTYPWEHQIVDDIIDVDSFNRIQTVCKHLINLEHVKKYPLLSKKIKQSSLGSWNLSQCFHIYDLINSGISEELVKLVFDISKQFLDIAPQIQSKYSNPRLFDSYQVVPKINMNFERYIWMVRLHPKNPITNLMVRQKYARIARELDKEFNDKLSNPD